MVQPSPVSDSQGTTSASKATNSTKQQTLPKIEQLNDCKYSLVLYGISECPNGTKRSDIVKHDTESLVFILSNLNINLQTNSARDCFRLGKFKKDQTRLCSLLLKLNRVIDVITILSNRISIKEKILLNQTCPLS